jgi:hypothetical protein
MKSARTRTARNYSQCDSLIGDKCGAHVPCWSRTPRRGGAENTSTSKIGEDQIFYTASAASRQKTP